MLGLASLFRDVRKKSVNSYLSHACLGVLICFLGEITFSFDATFRIPFTSRVHLELEVSEGSCHA